MKQAARSQLCLLCICGLCIHGLRGGLAACGTSDPGRRAFDSRNENVGPSASNSSATAGVVGPRRIDRLLFAVVGDTRPPTSDDTEGYPSGVIAKIYDDIESLLPRPPFVVSTGDYVFASTEGGQAPAQLGMYMQARKRYSGAFFPAMGNHECTGATSSNCGPGAADGVTPNYAAFVQAMLAPIGTTSPYYVIHLAASDRGWTAKLVFVAANAWSAPQQAWLESTLEEATTYTFLVRHEPASATSAPGVVPSERILGKHAYTLAIVGHSHTYGHDAAHPREVLVGNGGAPLTSKGYGFAIFNRRDDGAIVVDMVDWQTGRADAAFHFAVMADGTAAP